MIKSQVKNRIFVFGLAFSAIFFTTPLQGMGWVAGKIKSAASSVTPELMLSQKTVDDFKDIITSFQKAIEAAAEKVIQGSAYLRDLNTMKEKIGQLVQKISYQLPPAGASDKDEKSACEITVSFNKEQNTPNPATSASVSSSSSSSSQQSATSSVSSSRLQSNGDAQEKDSLIVQLKKDLELLKSDVEKFIKEFQSKGVHGGDDISGISKQLYDFRNKVDSIISICSSSNNTGQVGALLVTGVILPTLKEVQTKCEDLISTFKNKSLGGLYGTLETSIKKLGEVSDKTVAGLSVTLSRQMSTELRQVIGFPALQTLHAVLAGEITILESTRTIPHDFSSTLDGYNRIITAVTHGTYVDSAHQPADANNLTILQKNLKELSDQINNAYKRNDPYEQTLNNLRECKKKLTSIITTNNGMCGVFDQFTNNFIKKISDMLDDQRQKASQEIAQAGKSAWSFFKRGVWYTASVGLAAYSAYYLMKHHENPAKVRVGTGALLASLAYPAIDAGQTLWAFIKEKKQRA